MDIDELKSILTKKPDLFSRGNHTYRKQILEELKLHTNWLPENISSKLRREILLKDNIRKRTKSVESNLEEIIKLNNELNRFNSEWSV